MRVLFYGMQSSGASTLALTLAQKPDSVAFVDIWNMFAAPELKTDRDTVAKVVITSAFDLELHRRRFRPDVTILVLRHPVDTFCSLVDKSYANESGLIDEKFEILDQVLKEGKGVDEIFFYEDFVFSPRSLIELCDRIGWSIPWDALLFRRTEREIQETNAEACPGIHHRLKYGLGNIYGGSLLRDRVKFLKPWGRTSYLPQLCPTVFQRYAAAQAKRGERWYLPSRALLSCNLHRIVREVSGRDESPASTGRSGYKLSLTNPTAKCFISETALVLCPADCISGTRLSLAGLPGRPFNRVSGVAFAQHPGALGTVIRMRIESLEGETLAQQEFTLRHAEMRSVDLSFNARASTVTLSLEVRLAGGVQSIANAEVCFQDLKLDQADAMAGEPIPETLGQQSF